MSLQHLPTKDSMPSSNSFIRDDNFWLKKDTNDPRVQYKLGMWYRADCGVNADPKEAFRWLQKAALQKHTLSQYQLGQFYLHGFGTKKDEKQAFSLFKAAAKKGDLDAQYDLGICYYDGYGTDKNPKKAFHWFEVAAKKGFAGAQYELGLCYRHNVGIEKNFEKAFKWFKAAAEQGYASAQYALGRCYRDGAGTEINLKEAFQYFKVAADKECLDAQYALGRCYRDGAGTKKDPTQAFAWLHKAALQDNSDAQYALGVCYREGVGTKRNPKEAFQWFKAAAADKECLDAQYALGLCYLKGFGTDKYPKQAFLLIKAAAQKNVKDAQRQLGICYKNGIGTERDSTVASIWLQQADRNDRAHTQASAKNKKTIPPSKTLLQKKSVPPPTPVDIAAISAKAELEEKNTRIRTNQQKDTIDKNLLILEDNLETIPTFEALPQHQTRIKQTIEDIKKLKSELSNFHGLFLDQASKDLAVVEKRLLALKESYNDCKDYAALYIQVIDMSNTSADEYPALQQDIGAAISLHTDQLRQLQTKADKKNEGTIQQKQKHLQNLHEQQKKLQDIKSAHVTLQKKITGLDSLRLKERIAQVQDLHRALVIQKEEWVRYKSGTQGLVFIGISLSEFEHEKLKLQKAANAMVQLVPLAKAKKVKPPKAATNSTALITEVFAAAHASSTSSSPALTASSASTSVHTPLGESVAPTPPSLAVTSGLSAVASSASFAYGVDSVWLISAYPGKSADIKKDNKKTTTWAGGSARFMPPQKHDAKNTKERYPVIINVATKFNQLCQQSDLLTENPLVIKLAQEGAMFFFAQACLDTNKFREKTTSRKNLTELRDSLVHNRQLWNGKTPEEVNTAYQAVMKTVVDPTNTEPFGTEFLGAFKILLSQRAKHLPDMSLDIDTLSFDFTLYKSRASDYSAGNQLVWECANQFLRALPDFEQQLSNAGVGDSITGSIKKQGNKARHGQKGFQFLRELIDRLDKLVVTRGVSPAAMK